MRWLFALLAGLLLASPTMPVRIGYDMHGLFAPSSCTLSPWTDCAALPSRREALAEARAREEERARRQAAIAAGLRLVVSIPEQRIYVIRQGNLIATSMVSTGKRGHATPTGTFAILGKAIKHRSNIYSNAPMPYMQRLTDGGVALHAGHLPGYPASHGCIRLPFAFARQLYGMTDWTTRVIVTHAAPGSSEAAAGLAESGRMLRPVDETEFRRLAPVSISPAKAG